MTTKRNSEDVDLDEILDAQTSVESPLKPINIDISGFDAQQVDKLVHELTARRIAEALQIPELCTPQLLQAAMRFCSDNKITGLGIPEQLGAKVRDEFKDKAPFKLTGS